MGERGRQTKPDLVPLLGIALPRVTKIKESSNFCEDTNMGVVRRCGILYRHHILTSTTIPPHPQPRVIWYHHHWYGIPLHYYIEIHKAGSVSCAWRAFLSDNDSHVVSLRYFYLLGTQQSVSTE